MALHAGIDTGGTFTDLVVLDDETGAHRRRQGAVDAGRPGRRRSSARSRRPASTPRSLASVTARHDRRHERAARAQGRARAAAHDGGLRGRADDRAHRQGGSVRPPPREARAVRRAAPTASACASGSAADGTVVTPLDDAELERVAALLEPLLAEPGETSRSPSACSSRSPTRCTSGAWPRSSTQRFPGVPVAVSHRVRPGLARARAHDDDRRRRVPHARRRAASPASSSRASPRAASPGRRRCMKSNGGRMLAAAAGDQAVQTVLSGLAGGIVAGRHFGLAAGRRERRHLRHGRHERRHRARARRRDPVRARVRARVRAADRDGRRSTSSRSAPGGGSIAWVDDGGLLRVGPRSAGAVPGPACYGLGGADADRDRREPRARADRPGLAPRRRACSSTRRRRARRSRRSGARSASTPSRPPRRWSRSRTRAWPARSAASRSSAASTRATSSSSPSAAPARCTRPRSRRRSTWPASIVPPHPGLASAFGTLLADRRVDRRWTHYARSDARRRRGARRPARRDGAATRARRSPPRASPASRRSRGRWHCATRARTTSARCRWRPGRSTRPRSRAALAAFHELHHEVYGYSFPGEPVELIHADVAALGPGARPAPAALPEGEAAAAARAARRPLRRRRRTPTPVFRRETLPAGAVLHGPAVVEELDSTTLVLPGQELRVLADGILRLSGARSAGAAARGRPASR